jgi:large subunit ribosomal protein L6
MSRVGKKPIPVTEGVKVNYKDGVMTFEGPRGTLHHTIPAGIEVAEEDSKIVVTRSNDQRRLRSLHGLTRTLLANMIIGVSGGFRKNLEIVGVGYRAEVKGDILNLTLGYSQPIQFKLPEGISVQVERQTLISVEGIDKYLVGQVAAKIRDLRKPDPYKGKGIKYADEVIRRKVGKSSVTTR